jgi:hypothetical protein
MRMLLLAAVVAVMVAEGCGLGAEKERQRVRDEEFSAARMNGRFKADDPLVQMLSGSEREAMVRAGMMEESELDDAERFAEGEDGEEDGEGDDEKTTSQKAGDAVMSFLVVGVTLGMMAAPYLLF